MIEHIKALVEKIPYSVGSQLARVPFGWRLGRAYSQSAKVLESEQLGQAYVVKYFSDIFEYAKQHFPFYRELYQQAGVFDLEITTLSDIERLPIINKGMIRNHTEQFSGALALNTGGTSGEPFAFYVDSNAFAREWAHMHKIWAMRDYHYRDVKLTLRGKNLGEQCYRYNAVHNEFIINTYLPLAKFYQEILQLVERHSIKYLHGYPSAIYTFLKELDDCCSASQKALFRKHMRFCLLGSEFPQQYMVDYMSQSWGLDYISWYGHSEMCVLAYDQHSNNQYVPFHSYGYVEVVDERLIGTSYHNYDMPLIRYDTGDLVEAHYGDDRLLERFTVKYGRSGDYIVDASAKNIPLTAVIFGRHHEAFACLRSIQVRQREQGHAELLVTTEGKYTEQQLLALFDLSGIDIAFSVTVIDKPILSSAGKMPLLVRE